MRVKAVVFNLYNTLLHVIDPVNPYLGVARDLDPSIRKALDLRHAFMAEDRQFPELLEKLNLPQDDYVQQLEEELKRVVLFPDVNEVLSWLRRDGYMIGVISNMASPYKRPYYELGLHNKVDIHLFSCETGIIKPNPRIYLRLLSGMDLRPEDAMMVGDDVRCDYHGPKAVGMDAVLLDRKGKRSIDNTISSLAELPVMLSP
ncbi:MAG: HAD family hydrolase [Nanoarchaeota archaeon]|nr:HAD family hydrolase [Nanoarchaeota archaeon]